MIDITVRDDKVIQVEMKCYYSDYSRPINNQAEMIEMLKDVIEKVKYSGETISLWKIEGSNKVFIKDWH